MEIIDFHTHPFLDKTNNICAHKDFISMTPQSAQDYLMGMGISKICGSVISVGIFEAPSLQAMRHNNDVMLKLKELYGDFYIPGFHVNPHFLRESLEEIERMHVLGINLIGELVPYSDGWNDYSSKDFYEILELADYYGMTVSYHSMGDDAMDEMIKSHKNVTFIAAHPGEYAAYMRQLERFKMSENFYLDLSGTGLFRFGMLRRGIDTVGSHRFIFGSDFPTCNPAMFIGGILLDSTIKDEEKELILSKNIKRLLKID